ncbi:gag-pol polyprotein [Cucumis melo var. makuwa]|uniref:Gag-pol polyprotein n=1 Tax=Cucumis melo var. makuwa TaxID=1194695 RepID=A0A5D3DCZ8_CUCMM|nr:gag-pol polyprotein [Cucumis melo var. makuwa]
MEIIREGPSASRPPILGGKNYSYWKPRMIFFIKTLDGKAWRALVSGYEPSMITMNGVSVPKPEIDWTDAEEQASVGNARAINAIFNGVNLSVFKLINSCITAKEAWKILEVAFERTSKVKISRLQLITSKFEALKMTEDETVSEYNERVLEIANDSLLLGEKIPESKIVSKVLRSLPRKFDMKVTAIEEAQDIMTLKLDELFGSLLTFEMAISDRESKKGKGIAFKSIYDQENTVNQSGNEANQDESITLLTKQFSKMARKFKSLNTGGKTEKSGRHDGENSIRKVNDSSYRRNSDHGKKKEDVGRSFRCRECDGECSDIDEDKELTLEELKILRKEDSEAKTIQKERIQDLMDENERLMGIISSLKVKLKEVQNVYDQTIKSGKMLNSGTDSLDSILSLGQNGSSKYGLGFDTSTRGVKIIPEVKFVPASVEETTDPSCKKLSVYTGAKFSRWVYYYCDRRGHIRSFCYKLLRDRRHQQRPKLVNQQNKYMTIKRNDDVRGTHWIWRVKASEKCNVAFTTVQTHVDACLCLNLQREKGQKIIRIRSDHGKEFDNEDLNNFCQTGGIHHKFVVPITPQQNGVVEWRNITLQEMARVMIHAKNLPLNFWAEAVNTACHIHNRVTTRSGMTVTLYELCKGRKPNVKYFHIFGSTCYILADREYHRKWDAKSGQGIFLGYSQNSRAYRVFNIKSGTVMETINVVVNDFESNVNQFNIEDDETHVTPEVTSTPLDEMPKGESQLHSAKTDSSITDEVINNETMLVPSAHVKKNHPSSSIISDPSAGITTRRKEMLNIAGPISLPFQGKRKFWIKEEVQNYKDLCYVSAIEPTSVENSLKDEYWIKVMQEEFLQFKRNNVWTLVPKPDGANIIGTKWIFKNKTDESGSIIRNKARLVAQGYTQVEGVDCDETFAPVARLEAIRLLLSISCFQKFKLFQMDVKSAFLNGYLNEEVNVAEPKGFIDSEFPQYVYKLNKALYGLKQAPRACTDLIVAQIYVDDIIFGGFPKTLVDNFINIMKSEFEMSLVGELSCFLGLQIKQRSEGMFISQEKYAKNLVKKFGLDQSQHKRTPAATHAKITKDMVGTEVDHKLYRSMIGSLLYLAASRPDIVYAVGICARYQSNPRSADDRKSTSGGCFFLRNNLVSWFSKKQNCVSLSTVEAEYIAARNPRAAVHGIRVHGWRFKSTPPRRPYKLPYEKAHADIHSGSTESLHEETVSENVMKDAETAPAASEAHLSDIDSDDLDDVLLARLVKKVTVPDAIPKSVNDDVLSDSQESSSSEGVFVPTLGLCQTSSIEPGPSLYTSPIQPPIPNIAAPTDSQDVPPTAFEGGTEAPNEQHDTPLENVDDVEPVAPGDHNEEVHVTDSVDPSAPQETPSVPP